MMNSIAFIDTEIEPNSGKILDIGGIKGDMNQFHNSAVGDFIKFLQGAEFVCGHNIINHDMKYIHHAINDAGINYLNIIDTLFLSPLMFPTKPYHALLKDDKLQTEEANNPLNDSIKAKDLFFDEIAAFQETEKTLKEIYFLLLNDKMEFSAFFDFIGYKGEGLNRDVENVEKLIKEKFYMQICEEANFTKIIYEHPIELAYCLSLINTKSRYSITPPWVQRKFPEVEAIMGLLRSKPCLKGCGYCKEALDIYKGLKRYFGFDSYRTYAGEALQELAVKAAVDNKSVLAVFPTGGGKSITFQVPALMSGENVRGLTVVISPLQSLMKDQVDNLEKTDITEAVTINGLLDPIERAKSIERVADGSASILYISPESLRSKSIERLILGRNVTRFVIDEAHCFSAWGQDFRVDYLYIGDFIKSIQEKKNMEDTIPVSCFTATAKQRVIEDIVSYFNEKLSLNLRVFSSSASRTNLNYKVFEKENEEEKYNTIRNLIEEKNCPTIIYVSRTKKAFLLAERLTKDGYIAKPYHGKMDKKEKSENQDEFINGNVQIMVATSAFGMGVDKKDVGMVIHYDISDSLENYVQEAGRAGRDENISAECFVLFNDEDLSKHFIRLNQTKLNIQEIQQIWKAIKELTRFRLRVSNSAFEIAKKAGWDDSVLEVETRVKTAVAALEEAGYVKRGQNSPRVYADSILFNNAKDAIEKIMASNKFQENQKEKAVRIIKNLIASRSRKGVKDEATEAEARVDYISDRLGIEKEEVINIVYILREENILADAKDLTAFIKRKENKNRSLNILKSFHRVESFLLTVFIEEEKTFHLKELNQLAEENGCKDPIPNKIKTILNYWAIKHWIKRGHPEYSKNHVTVLSLHSRAELEDKLTKRHELANFVLEFLYDRSITNNVTDDEKEEVLVEFSVNELKVAFEKRITIFGTKASIEDMEDTLFYLSRIDALKIEGGFLVVYNPITIERIEGDNRKRFNSEDYQKLKQYYESKVEQIHIVGEYAKKMIKDYKDALQFVEDYFQLNYKSFLNKYFKGSRQNEIKRNLTPAKFQQLFGELSTTQLKIINDKDAKYIVVAAGPGSGKTRVLVHKLASLLLMEDVKYEQLLMVTFSRAAATEFKKLLMNLIGNAANFIEIKTFHSYCFDLLGKVGTIEKSTEIIKMAIEKIKKGEVETRRITKTVLVIDEAQDMDADEFALIITLMEQNEGMRVIAVGDDDQNIYEFRGASSKYLEAFIEEKKAVKHELFENFRSKNNLVEFANQFVERLSHRLKNIPILANQRDNGRIKLIRYKGGKLITPLIKDIVSAELTGTTCVLTENNDDALMISGLLKKNGLESKLIQSNEGFNLYNIVELRYFLDELNLSDDKYTICDEVWARAKGNLKDKFARSSRLELCLNIIKDFESINTKSKYKSDLEIFIRESRIEDFWGEKRETIFVSTIHKAKGREFDNVFLLLDSFKPLSDEDKRRLYVGMTRAKRNLTIHLNRDFLDAYSAEDLQRFNDIEDYLPPNELIMQLGHKDVWLDYFKDKQELISELHSGDDMIVDENGCSNIAGQRVLMFSNKFKEDIKLKKEKNYLLKTAKVNFIILWKKENAEKEINIILPELYFEKT